MRLSLTAPRLRHTSPPPDATARLTAFPFPPPPPQPEVVVTSIAAIASVKAVERIELPEAARLPRPRNVKTSFFTIEYPIKVTNQRKNGLSIGTPFDSPQGTATEIDQKSWIRTHPGCFRPRSDPIFGKSAGQRSDSRNGYFRPPGTYDNRRHGSY